MKRYPRQLLQGIGRGIFMACGSPQDEAELTADVLVDANLMGLDSHGVIRYRWYADEVKLDRVRPGGEISVTRETTTTATLDGGRNFGTVAAARAVDLAVEKARDVHVGCVVVHNCHHVARLGAFTERAARDEMICLAWASWPKAGHFVAPWGGREGRLATNPFAYAVPSDDPEDPMTLDMSTSAISEGKIRVHQNQAQPLPEDTVVDAAGKMTRDPEAFYGPPAGAILPFGGGQGFKGFGLAMLGEILSGTLSGDVITDEDLYGNRVCFLVINPRGFIPLEHFRHGMGEMVAYIKSCPLREGFERIIMPGEYFVARRRDRLRNGIPLDDETWRQVVDTAKQLGVEPTAWGGQ